MLERTRLDGKVAIVTGGGRGLGKAMATSLAEAGAQVCIAARTESQLLDAAAEIRDISGTDALTVPTDINDSAQCDALIARTVEHFGRLDIIINNAGGGGRGGPMIWEYSDQDWHDTISSNLDGTFYCSRAAARVMVDQGQGGVIVNISSGTALRALPTSLAYGSAKAGVISFTQTLSSTLIRHGIRVNCIVPGFFTQAPAVDAEDQQTREARGRLATNRRLGDAWELGPLAVYLCSDASSYMNGEICIVDGGGLAGGVAPTGWRPDLIERGDK